MRELIIKAIWFSYFGFFFYWMMFLVPDFFYGGKFSDYKEELDLIKQVAIATLTPFGIATIEKKDS